MPSTPAATFLFAHGGGFCKQIWDPIIRRLKVSPLVQQVAADFVTFVFPYHGTKRDESVAPKLEVEDTKSPRVWHPAQNLLPTTTAEVQHQVHLLRKKHDAQGSRPALIGVGHSMGAGALWNAEVKDPGTFDALIMFEPVYGLEDGEMGDKVTSFLVSVTLQRESTWSSRKQAEEYFATLKNFSSWDRESLAAYVEGALVEDEATGKTVLACHPQIEASLYCHDILHFSDDELKRPKCSVRFHRGERSNMFFTPYFEAAVNKCPDIYSIGAPMEKCSHLLVLEDPTTTANKILSDLAKTAPFRQAPACRI
uniref:AB hydrolase-1 domain-containing protein n=1 Tax=Phytophthora ramorum TaxID=164328 RepID=H3GQS3_PHYRM